jgi:hypothetical protein
VPRPIFLNKEKSETKLSVDSFAPTKVLSPMELDRKLRQKRSSKYMESMTKLDSGGHVANNEIIQSLIVAIREELPEITIDQLPVGIVAKCYLEPPHEVHCLDRDGEIIKHYKSFEPLPPLLERARSLAIHGGYAFIEVYHYCLRAVKNDGTISVVKED